MTPESTGVNPMGPAPDRESPPASFPELWRAEHDRVQDALSEEDLDDPDGGVAGDHEPLDARLRRDLRMGLQLMYHHPESPKARRLFLRARSLARAAMGQAAGVDPGRPFPLERARIRRTFVYLDFLLRGELDVDVLLDAAGDFEAWCRGRLPFDDVLQAHWLAAIRLLMIAGELTRARMLLEVHPHLSHHPEEYEIFARILRSALELRDPTPSLLAELDRYFDHVRHPHARVAVYREMVELRLELALLRERYFTSPDGAIDLLTSLRSVSRG